ncbi:carboxy-S-adenosyl-L-methionine synthase CmoA [Helicobacter sp. CLO-3]|uniref:carboxy-S-adenosyl-L-methionine synthase CmoA n=1 Tax=unclassified Helicobacter TaxID=2593540 RepID=UPI000805A685|nr:MULTISPECIES: carboxy-S-adenosyl-L-methionine synthase CmoA [unclassified Helicobacter]OBV28827.1 tRNA (uridine-5-oxyacetic acid methyl ester)(34) synthase TrmP [Helicobacter sp. CLO-3]OHU81232.1 carboxy-S-adenosyl-L-methionine synthase CmoA [Helicobacter sp. CLO-3]
MPKNTPPQTPAKDTIFQNPTHKKFEFDAQVASVFDDMLARSIPYYKDTLELCVDFMAQNIKRIEQAKVTESSQNAESKSADSGAPANPQKSVESRDSIDSAPKSKIYDLGCSTGNTLLALRNRVDSELIGLDSSEAMIHQAKLKAKAYSANIEFVCADFMEVAFARAQGFIANYTLQFIRPPMRAKLVSKIYDALDSGGVLIVSEKTTSANRMLDSQMIAYYHAYKARNGYTTSEIAAKREALENVLVPYSLDENIALLKDAGFSHVEVLFKWVNFATLIAVK